MAAFTETSTSIAAVAGCGADTVRLYADAGFIESIRLANGVRLFQPDAAAKVRALKMERIAHRGASRKPMRRAA